MKRALFVLLLGFLFGHSSCTSSKENSFEDLSAQQRLDLKKELIDSLRGEMVKYMEAVDDFFRNTDPICSSRNSSLRIVANKKSQIMIRNNIKEGIIGSTIRSYLTTNRLINDPTTNALMFVGISKKEIQDFIKSDKRQILDMKSAGNYPDEMIQFKEESALDWEQKLAILNVLKIDTIAFIDDQYSIEISYYPEIKGQPALVDSVLNAICNVRNLASKEHIHQSYLEVFYNYKFHPSKENKIKIEALKWIYPVRVIDAPYAKKHNLKMYWDLSLPEPIVLKKN
jgi:hypothetical protein